MSEILKMESDLFGSWVHMLILEGYDWDKNGISNEQFNKISIPKHGIELLDWTSKTFRVINEQQYTLFLLRYT